MPVPAPPSNEPLQLKRNWDPLQWRFSFFDDLVGKALSESEYSELLPSKYAIKVTKRSSRCVMCAHVCVRASVDVDVHPRSVCCSLLGCVTTS